jgi:two-component system response regulator DcuR
LAQVDLLLLDVYMQQENGLDLLPALRAMRAILMSS